MSIKARIASPIIIIGMHRSGTSMLTRLLQGCGVYVGRRLSVNHEAKYFQKLNRQIMATAGGRWDDILPVVEKMGNPEFVQQQADNLREKFFRRGEIMAFFPPTWKWRLLIRLRLIPRPWGWKDPRNSITLPLWLNLFPQAKIIHMIRNGFDVAISLHRRETKREPGDPDASPLCTDFGYCFFLWEQYIQTGWQFSQLARPGHYLELKYEALLQDPEKLLKSVLDFIDRPLDSIHLGQIATRVDRSRLNNETYRDKYRLEIAGLSDNSLMAHLDYIK